MIILIIAKNAQMKLAVVSIKFNNQDNYVITDHYKHCSDKTSCIKYLSFNNQANYVIVLIILNITQIKITLISI